MKIILRSAKKFGVAILGLALLIVGVILLVLPGPGILFIILGLVVLSWEFTWAERHLERAKSTHKKNYRKSQS